MILTNFTKPEQIAAPNEVRSLALPTSSESADVRGQKMKKFENPSLQRAFDRFPDRNDDRFGEFIEKCSVLLDDGGLFYTYGMLGLTVSPHEQHEERREGPALRLNQTGSSNQIRLEYLESWHAPEGARFRNDQIMLDLDLAISHLESAVGWLRGGPKPIGDRK